MPGLNLIPGVFHVSEVAFTPAEIAANVAAEQTVTVPGVDPDTTLLVAVEPPAHGQAVGIAGARISAKNTVAVTFVNPTAGALTPSAGTYKLLFTLYK